MTAQLWVLYPREGRDAGEDPDPWSPWYDKCFKMVVRATSEERARELAQEEAAAESTISPVFHNVPEYVRDRQVWTEPELAECVPVEEYGEEEGVLIKDVKHA